MYVYSYVIHDTTHIPFDRRQCLLYKPQYSSKKVKRLLTFLSFDLGPWLFTFNFTLISIKLLQLSWHEAFLLATLLIRHSQSITFPPLKDLGDLFCIYFSMVPLKCPKCPSSCLNKWLLEPHNFIYLALEHPCQKSCPVHIHKSS